jgi:phospholipase C
LAGLREKIAHVVVLMLENRSFDCLLGTLKRAGAEFDGLAGHEFNTYTPLNGSPRRIDSWNDSTLYPGLMTIPDPDPGELFSDINLQLFGLGGAPDLRPPPMSGFVDNYMRQPKQDRLHDAKASMHYYTPDQVPVMSLLASSFAVSDQWYASAPCQTWPNRFFLHTATAGGFTNNSPPHFPYLMPSIFHRLAQTRRTSRIYFHDIPQSITLADQWLVASERFRPIQEFWDDADHGDLPDYSFIEPRYFTDTILGLLPNDQHPPHDIIYGEQLIAKVYNAVRASPAWKKTLFVVTYDEHGGCYDHAPPPLAAPPQVHAGPDGFLFDRYGVRVPAILVSPYVAPGTVLRSAPAGLQDARPAPFDHTSIIRTLRELFDPNGVPLTNRDASAPSLDLVLNLDRPSNDGPDYIELPSYMPTASEIARAKDLPPNDLQRSLCSLSSHLPRAETNILQYIDALKSNLIDVFNPVQACVADAEKFVRNNVESFLG